MHGTSGWMDKWQRSHKIVLTAFCATFVGKFSEKFENELLWKSGCNNMSMGLSSDRIIYDMLHSIWRILPLRGLHTWAFQPETPHSQNMKNWERYLEVFPHMLMDCKHFGINFEQICQFSSWTWKISTYGIDLWNFRLIEKLVLKPTETDICLKNSNYYGKSYGMQEMEPRTLILIHWNYWSGFVPLVPLCEPPLHWVDKLWEVYFVLRKHIW